MADVLILVGSDSDKPRIEPAFEILTKAGVTYEFHVSSAHRQPDATGELVKTARAKGFKVVIAGAGLSAALPGFAASLTDLPVIGVPFAVGPLNGLDALLATVQVPPGVPVATVGIDNAKNAAYLALRILGRKA
jgi:5-(carboxyamino)imidazole ribonucleotide mutase